MPYASNEELPQSVKDNIPSDKGKTLFRDVFNSQMARGKSESVSFASAWAALSNAGYEENSKGKWIKKGQPTLFDVHVPSADWEEYEKAEYQGRDVDLDKPFRLPSGSGKKFGVYVRDGDKIKRVTFGDPDMEIRRDDPDARANFRARHNCDQKKDKTTAGYWSCRMWDDDSVSDMVAKCEADVTAIAKRQLADDVYTLREEAAARSMDLGLGGNIHVYEIDGQAVYMPGRTHDDYMAAYGRGEENEDEGDDEEEDSPEHERLEFGEKVLDLIGRIVGAILPINSEAQEKESMDKDPILKVGRILKVDDEQRMVYGWASVVSENGVPVVDRQGDIISPSEMEKAANSFMMDVRAAKAMHDGDTVGEFIHSLPLTKQLAEALGVNTENNREGWIVGMKVYDDDVWKRVKSGELRAFSIGGAAMKEAVNAN